MRTLFKTRRWLGWLVYLCLFFILVTAVDWWRTRDISGVAAPVLEGRMLSGEFASLDDYRERPVLVYFWATWCPICRLSASSIDSLAQDWPVLTVATSSGDADEIKAYMQELALDFDVMLDETGELARNWGVKGVPTSFIVNPENTIDAASTGFSSETGLRFRLWMAED